MGKGDLVKRRLLGAAIAGLLGAYWIYARGVELEPDTIAYAHGHGWWSSPLAALVGRLGGIAALQALGLVGAVAFGLVVSSSSRGLLLAAAASYTLGVGVASADALAAAALVVAGRSWPLVSVLHLETAVCAAGSRLAARRALPAWAGAAVAGACCIVGETIVNPAAFQEPQLRYLLPAIALAATSSSRPSGTSLAAPRSRTRGKPDLVHAWGDCYQ